MKATTWMGLLATAAGAAACSSSGNGKLALTVRNQASAAAVATTAPAGVDLGNGIVLTEVRMVVRRLTLLEALVAPDGGADGGIMPATESGDGGTEDDADESEGPGIGPFFVDVLGDALKKGIHPSFDGSVPKGTYSGARISVNTVSAAQAKGNPGLEAMQALHASIVADGTIDGTAFEFATPIQVSQVKGGPITIGDKTTNLTLDVDPTGWFTGADGARLDPRDSTALGQILENIRCSIRLIRDDDGDGLPDDGDDGEHCPSSGGTLPQ